MAQSSIWVLCGARAGDTAQALELARRVGGHVRPITLEFNARHVLPNWMCGASLHSLTPSSRQQIVPPWPDLVIATGKRTAAIAAWIKRQSAGTSLAVQLGRPRMSYKAFDLIVTTPQYDLPKDPKVVLVPLPFAAPNQVRPDVLKHWSKTWRVLPRPWIAAAIGAKKFPLRLGHAQIDAFAEALDALARRLSGSLLLFESPRTSVGALQRLRSRITVPHVWDHGGGPGRAYQAALLLADQFAVTGDSVSMVSEMLATGRPVHVLALPRWPAPRWTSALPGASALAQSGLLVPTRNVHRFMMGLLEGGHVGDLHLGTAPRSALDFEVAQEKAVMRIRSLLNRS